MLSGRFEAGWYPGAAVEQVTEGVEFADAPFGGDGQVGLDDGEIGESLDGPPAPYPLNTSTGMCINTAIAYPVYIAPVVFPKIRWLGLAPVLFGMSQAVGHGFIFPRIAGDKYSPGFLASILLHVPIGVTYIKAVQALTAR